MNRYNIVIGPINDDPDGFSPEDFKEMLTDAGWRNVRIEWLAATPSDVTDGPFLWTMSVYM